LALSAKRGRARSVSKGWRETRHCSWCELLLEATTPVLYEEAAFVVVAPRPDLREREYLTVVPRAHVARIGELEPEEMASVLAGLSRLVLGMKRTYHVDEVEVRPHPKPPSGHGHLHFHLIPKAVPVEQGGVTTSSSPPKLSN